MSWRSSVKPEGTAAGKQRLRSEKANTWPGGVSGTTMMIEYGISITTSTAVRLKRATSFSLNAFPFHRRASSWPHSSQSRPMIARPRQQKPSAERSPLTATPTWRTTRRVVHSTVPVTFVTESCAANSPTSASSSSTGAAAAAGGGAGAAASRTAVSSNAHHRSTQLESSLTRPTSAVRLESSLARESAVICRVTSRSCCNASAKAVRSGPRASPLRAASSRVNSSKHSFSFPARRSEGSGLSGFWRRRIARLRIARRIARRRAPSASASLKRATSSARSWAFCASPSVRSENWPATSSNSSSCIQPSPLVSM